MIAASLLQDGFKNSKALQASTCDRGFSSCNVPSMLSNAGHLFSNMGGFIGGAITVTKLEIASSSSSEKQKELLGFRKVDITMFKYVCTGYLLSRSSGRPPKASSWLSSKRTSCSNARHWCESKEEYLQLDIWRRNLRLMSEQVT